MPLGFVEGPAVGHRHRLGRRLQPGRTRPAHPAPPSRSRRRPDPAAAARPAAAAAAAGHVPRLDGVVVPLLGRRLRHRRWPVARRLVVVALTTAAAAGQRPPAHSRTGTAGWAGLRRGDPAAAVSRGVFGGAALDCLELVDRLGLPAELSPQLRLLLQHRKQRHGLEQRKAVETHTQNGECVSLPLTCSSSLHMSRSSASESVRSLADL